MTDFLFTNNAQGTLSADITSLATSLSLGVGEGVLFPNPTSGQVFRATIQSGALQEIVEVTARVGDTFTIVRAKENTTARAWTAGATVQLRLTAEIMERLRDGKTATQAIGALTPATDYAPYFTGSSTAGLFALTAFSRSLLASVSAAAWRTLLSAVSLTGVETLTNKTLTSPVINGGTIDGAVIGGTTPAAGTFTTLAANTLAMTGGAGVIPVGGIIMWSGAISAIPAGWALCNGSNGTPDLRDKFVIGANADDSGVAKTNITGTPTLSGGSKDAVNVSHTHTATVTDPGHTHNAGGSQLTNTGATYNARTTATGSTATSSATTGVTVSNSTEGESGTNKNLPPYYALAFIMKTA